MCGGKREGSGVCVCVGGECGEASCVCGGGRGRGQVCVCGGQIVTACDKSVEFICSTSVHARVNLLGYSEFKNPFRKNYQGYLKATTDIRYNLNSIL